MATSVFTQFTELSRSVGGRANGTDYTTRFRHQTAQIVPWERLENDLELHYPKAHRIRPPMPLELMIPLG